jgi:hypothetical protein
MWNFSLSFMYYLVSNFVRTRLGLRVRAAFLGVVTFFVDAVGDGDELVGELKERLEEGLETADQTCDQSAYNTRSEISSEENKTLLYLAFVL